LISCDGFSCQKYLTHSAYLLVENNALALPAPPVPVPGLSVGPGDQVKQDADKTIASGLDGAIKGLGDAVDKATQCSFGRACSSEEGEKKSQPNAGKELTDEQKKELGGTGSGTPGGWGPEDEEGARNNESASQQDKINAAKDRYPKQYDQYNKLPDKNLEKAISKHDKKIAEHQGYLNDPIKRQEHVPDWKNLSPKHQENLLHHWQQDVNIHEAYKAIAEDILKGRK
jgi:filamentous hemagglutinin